MWGMKLCRVFKKEEMAEMLSQKPFAGKHQLEPLKSLFLAKELPFGVIEDFGVLESEAEIHKNEGDLWFGLEGEVEFTLGGELVDPWIKENGGGNEIGGKSIKGGKVVILKPGDWLWIPPGEPHLHNAKFGRMAIIKIRI